MTTSDIESLQRAFYEQRGWRTDVYHYVGNAVLVTREGIKDVIYGVWYGNGRHIITRRL